jgi:hypothetical protein
MKDLLQAAIGIHTSPVMNLEGNCALGMPGPFLLAGGDIISYDRNLPLENEEWNFTRQWFPIQIGGPERIKDHRDRTLLLVWPPCDEPLASQALANYSGKTVIFVGEDRGGCTGDDRFFDLLEENFQEEEVIHIPTWLGISDHLLVCRKR